MRSRAFRPGSEMRWGRLQAFINGNTTYAKCHRDEGAFPEVAICSIISEIATLAEERSFAMTV
jgi:hypothetical protein